MSLNRLAKSTQHPWVMWLALLLAVYSALTPLRFHAHVGSRGEVVAMGKCTSTGMCWVEPERTFIQAIAVCGVHLPPSGTTDPQSGGRIWDHCPLCLIFGVFGALTSQILKADFAGPSALALPRLEPDFFHAAFVAPSPPSRGPPIF
jgi:hypothetical protein